MRRPSASLLVGLISLGSPSLAVSSTSDCDVLVSSLRQASLASGEWNSQADGDIVTAHCVTGEEAVDAACATALSTHVTADGDWSALDRLLSLSPSSLCSPDVGSVRPAADPSSYESDFSTTGALQRLHNENVLIPQQHEDADLDTMLDTDLLLTDTEDVRVLDDDADANGETNGETNDATNGETNGESNDATNGETDGDGDGDEAVVSVSDAVSAMDAAAERARSRARSAREDLKQMKSVLSATQEFRAMQKEMQEAAMNAAQRQALHSMRFGTYFKKPLGCPAGADDPLCESTSLMNGMAYLTSETGQPLGGLFGGAQGLSMMAKIG